MEDYERIQKRVKEAEAALKEVISKVAEVDPARAQKLEER